MQRYIVARSTPRRKMMIQSFGQGMNAAMDKEVLPIHIAKHIYNFDFSSGALIEGYGLKSVPYITRKITNLWTFKRYDFDKEQDEEILMYSCPEGFVYYVQNLQEYRLEGIQFTSIPRAVNYRLYGDDVILMTSSSDVMAVWDGKNAPYTVPNSPHITSMTIHFERMFSTVGGERNAVWFSRDLDPTNWDLALDRGGFIQMLDERGKLNKVVSFLNFVYVLRDFGISRISAFADQTDFSTSNLFVSSGRIYAQSATLCGDRILFLASDGLYAFDGLSTQRIMQRLDSVVRPSPHSASCFHNGKYYLSFRIEDDEGLDNDEDNNAVLVYEVQTGLFSILKGVCVRNFAKCGEVIYGVTREGDAAYVERCGSVFGEATPKSWVSGHLDFGTERVKTIREIYVSSDTPFTMTLQNERSEKSFEVVPEPGVTRIRVNMSGRKFTIGLKVHSTLARINRPTVVLTT